MFTDCGSPAYMGIEISDSYTAMEAAIGFVAFA